MIKAPEAGPRAPEPGYRQAARRAGRGLGPGGALFAGAVLKGSVCRGGASPLRLGPSCRSGLGRWLGPQPTRPWPRPPVTGASRRWPPWAALSQEPRCGLGPGVARPAPCLQDLPLLPAWPAPISARPVCRLPFCLPACWEAPSRLASAAQEPGV